MLLLLIQNPHPEAPIELSQSAIKSTFIIAEEIMKVVHWLLSAVGLEHNIKAIEIAYAAVVLCIAVLVGRLLQWGVMTIIKALQDRVHNVWYLHLREVKFFTKSCRIIPPLVFVILIEFTMEGSLGHTLTLCSYIYMVFVVAMALNSIVDASWLRIDEKENKRKLPLKGVAQLIKGIIWIVVAIIICAMLLQKSPEKVLAGLGAFAAVLMLVFKDSILGVVAGVQLSENDTLHVGDWIKVHGTDANGTVQEVTLTSVKIVNWDKTVTTVPPYTLVSGSFTNYRNMQLSETRRIQRCYLLDADTVMPLTDADLERLKAIPLLEPYITAKMKQRDEGKIANYNNPEGLVDGTIDTNLGLFRAYLALYLKNNKGIDPASTCFISTLQQTSAGIPLQIYCFTDTSSWVPYEMIQSEIFEHIAVMLHKFGLTVFESASGRDTIMAGYIPAMGVDHAFGLPYPMGMDKDIYVNPHLSPGSQFYGKVPSGKEAPSSPSDE